MSFEPDSSYVDSLHPSPNIGARRGSGQINTLILHYTGLPTVERSIAVLADPVCEVSCHYVVDIDGSITQMVREADRAWHAGKSYWCGETDINSLSVGIEIQNPGHEAGYPGFPERQMHAVEQLARDIVVRNHIPASRVLAHSDVAPQRKIDPGEKFDWQRLAEAGVGYWRQPMMPTEVHEPASSESVARVQVMLARYGYEVAQHGQLDEKTRKVIGAFQRHFRPERVDGLLDQSTLETLQKLLDGLNTRSAGPAT